MIIYLGLIGTIALFLICLLSPNYKNPLIALILIRPIVGATWNFRYSDMSLIYIFNAGFIVIFLLRIFLRREKVEQFPLMGLFFFYTWVTALASIKIYLSSGFVTSLDFFAKSSFMPLSFYLFFAWFKKDKDRRALIGAMIITGFFPLFFTLYQVVTGHVWVPHVSRGLVRSVGLYHDLVTPKIFFMQSLIGIYIYWNYFIKKKDIKAKLTWLGLTIIFLAGLYFLYSKAVFVTLALWAMMFIFIRGRFVLLPVALVALLSLSLFTSNRVLNDINQVFSSETEYARGELESQYVLSGRVGIWKSYINLWKTLPVTDKLIGYGRSHGWFHNEYLRLLFSGGLLLLFAFLILATMIFVRVFRNFRRTGKATYFAALLCFALLFVESAGQLPGSYPDFQTFVWGIIGLSFNSISYADPFSNLITRRAEFYRLARG